MRQEEFGLQGLLFACVVAGGVVPAFTLHGMPVWDCGIRKHAQPRPLRDTCRTMSLQAGDKLASMREGC
jgi:hypothetical protein